MLGRGFAKGALVLGTAFSVACGSTSRNGTESEQAGGAGGMPSSPGGSPNSSGSSSAGRGGNGGSAGTVLTTPGGAGQAASGGFPACPPPSGEVPPVRTLGFASYGLTAFSGVVSAVTDQNLTIETPEGMMEVFTWQGPSLEPDFAPGTDVSVDFAPAGPGGLGPPKTWAVVRSSTATAAALKSQDGFWTQASTELGSIYGVMTPTDFPVLALINTGCCSPNAGGGGGSGVSCSFASLRISVDDQTATVAAHDTVEVGEWAVTHLGGSYTTNGELIVGANITLLGPATSAP